MVFSRVFYGSSLRTCCLGCHRPSRLIGPRLVGALCPAHGGGKAAVSGAEGKGAVWRGVGVAFGWFVNGFYVFLNIFFVGGGG